MSDLVDEASKIVTSIAGIQLGQNRFSMISARIQRRMSKLGITSNAEYLSFIQQNLASESQALIGLLTTHHTHFFREFQHFEFLGNGALQNLVKVKIETKSEKKNPCLVGRL